MRESLKYDIGHKTSEPHISSVKTWVCVCVCLYGGGGVCGSMICSDDPDGEQTLRILLKIKTGI